MRIAIGLLMLACANPASAQQEAKPIAGRWAGEVSEPGAEPSRYPVQANIVLDRNGAPVGTVRYGALGCGGLWIPTDGDTMNWEFQEVITEDSNARCAAHMRLELIPANGVVRAEWRDFGSDQVVASATLRRRR